MLIITTDNCRIRTLLAAVILLILTLTLRAETASLRLGSSEISLPMPEGWQYAVPGPLVSIASPEHLQPGMPLDVLYPADRQFLSHQDAVDQMYEEAGRLDHFLLHRLITGRDLETVVPFAEIEGLAPDSVDPKVSGVPRQRFERHFDGSTYVMTPDYEIEHRGGPDPIGEGKVQSEIVFGADTGNVIIAASEISGTNFRPSIHFGISSVGEYITDENRSYRQERVDPQTGDWVIATGRGQTVHPRNTAELVNLHLARLRKGFGDAIVKVENRRTEVIGGKDFVGVTLIWQRGNAQVIQDQFRRKEGERHWYFEVTTMSPSDRDRALGLLESAAIRETDSTPQ